LDRKRAFHFWSPGGVRRRHAAALPPLLRLLLLLLLLLCTANLSDLKVIVIY